MPSLSSSLPQLRESLASLESYQLPDRYKPLQTSKENSNDPNSDSNSSSSTIIDPQLFQRYLKAKDTYLRKRMNHLFIEHLSTLQFTTNKENHNQEEEMKISFPSKLSPSDVQELQSYQQKVSKDLLQTIHNISTSYDNVNDLYKVLMDKKDDLKHVIETLEQKEMKQFERKKNDDLESKDGEEDVTIDFEYDAEKDNDNGDGSSHCIDESELILEEEKLRTLRERRGMMEMKLHKLQMEKELVKSKIQKDYQLVKALIDARNGYSNHENVTTTQHEGNVIENDVSFDFNNLPSIEEIQIETTKLQEQARNYQDMAEYYDSIKCAMEVIGGMKILSIQSKIDTTDADGDLAMSSPSTSPTKYQSPAKKRQNRHLSSPLNDDNLSTVKDKNDSINLRVLLLDSHIVNLALTASGPTSSTRLLSTKNGEMKNQEPLLSYRVNSAQFETPTIITETIHDDHEGNNNSNKSSETIVSMAIPALDDLVSLSKNMQPLDDIRFILREALARIRIVTQRVDVLAQLKLKYLTKITNPMKNKVKFGYGGEYQEVVCSLPCQVTVVLRLTCDCPLLDGSAYIHQIVGVSGWNSECLERIKKKVNMKKWRSPIQTMESLEEEIGKVVRDEGISLPKTPSLPSKRK